MNQYIKLTKETRKTALKAWRQYREAEKLSDMPVYKDLKKVYAQLKNGATVIDIHDVFSRSGVRENFHPKLAIALATNKKVYCQYHDSGNIAFRNQNNHWHTLKHDVWIREVMPKIPKERLSNDWSHDLKLEAPVPIIPPQFLPAKLTKDYYILWEVDEWKELPPKDPYLLRRITNNMFVVLAAWDLTPVERSVMKGRM